MVRNANQAPIHKAMYGTWPKDAPVVAEEPVQPSPSPQQAVTVREEMHIDIRDVLQLNTVSFTGVAQRPEPEQTRRFLSWHKGLLATRRDTGEAIANYAGWAVEWPMVDGE